MEFRLRLQLVMAYYTSYYDYNRNQNWQNFDLVTSCTKPQFNVYVNKMNYWRCEQGLLFGQMGSWVCIHESKECSSISVIFFFTALILPSSVRDSGGLPIDPN